MIAVTFSTDNRFFVVRSKFGGSERHRIYRTDPSEQDVPLTGSNEARAVTFSPDNRLFKGKYQEVSDFIELRRTATPEQVMPLTKEEACLFDRKCVVGIKFSPAGVFFVVVYANDSVELRRTAEPEATVVQFTGKREVSDVTFSPDGTFLMVKYSGGSAVLRRTDSPKRDVPLGEETSDFLFPDKRYFVLGYRDGHVELRRTAMPGARGVQFEGASKVTFSPDNDDKARACGS